MARFKIGQKVVALGDSNSRPAYGQGDSAHGKYFKKGDVLVVDGYSRCQKCGKNTIYLKGMNKSVINTHSCGAKYDDRQQYLESDFAPLANISDAIEYKLKVSIPELTEIKETQLQ